MADSGKIFINYRRGDDPGHTGRLYDRLQSAFKSEQLFMDVEGGIGAGADFVEVLREQVAKSDVLLAVIGPNWLSITDAAGGRRLDNPDDWVRVEIEAAMNQGKLVIPVLVGHAAMPTAEQLPTTLKPLARRNAVRLTHERFQADCAGLIKALETELEKAVSTRETMATEARRAAAEADRKREEDAQRRRQEEAERQRARARLDTAANLTPEQIYKAEELANWEFIKDSKEVDEFRDHLARFPVGVTLRMVRARLEALKWDALGPSADHATLKGFLEEFPDGANASNAMRRLAELDEIDRVAAERKASAAAEEKVRIEKSAREASAWEAVKNTTDRATIDAFLKDWPDGINAAEAKRLRRAMGGSEPDRSWLRMALAYALLAPISMLAIAWLIARSTGLMAISASRFPMTALYALPAFIILATAFALRWTSAKPAERALFWIGNLPILGILYLSYRQFSNLDDANLILPELLAGLAGLAIAPFLVNRLGDGTTSIAGQAIHWLGVALVVACVIVFDLMPLVYLNVNQSFANETGLPLHLSLWLIGAGFLLLLGAILAYAHRWTTTRLSRISAHVGNVA